MLPPTGLIPIHDENPTRRFAVVTLMLIILNILVFFIEPNFGTFRDCRASQNETACDQSNLRAAQFVCSYGVVPREITNRPPSEPRLCSLVPGRTPTSDLSTLFTSMFLHGGLLHLGGNLLFLWIFGNNIEDTLGKIRYLLFYLTTGVLAGLTHAFGNPTSDIATIGASGAVAGVLGAYIVLFPRARITTVVPVMILFTARIPAVVMLGLWFVSQFFIGGGQQAGAGVAWMAHVGGFIAGAILIFAFGGWQRRARPVYY